MKINFEIVHDTEIEYGEEYIICSGDCSAYREWSDGEVAECVIGLAANQVEAQNLGALLRPGHQCKPGTYTAILRKIKDK